MSNAYGTKEYEEYIEAYRKFADSYGFVKTEKEEEHFEISGIKFDLITFLDHLYKSQSDSYPEGLTISNKITVTLKNGKQKIYRTVDTPYMPQVFSYRDVDYIFMRKALYGYCIIDSRNFDEYNYFPSEVLEDGNEAFISAEAHCLGDLLIIVGCYWGAPYEVYVLDIESKKAIRLGNYLSDKELELKDDSIKLSRDGFSAIYGEKEILFAYDDLKQQIEKDGTFDF